MSTPRLIVDQQGAVLVLTMDHPTRRNAFAMPIRLAMIEALDQAQRDKSVRAVVRYPVGTSLRAMAVTTVPEV